MSPRNGKPTALRKVYCQRACIEDWPKRNRRTANGRHKLGLRFAEESRRRPGTWYCLCCGARVPSPLAWNIDTRGR